MDLRNNVLFSCNDDFAKTSYGDTTLSLDCFGYGRGLSTGPEIAQTNSGERHAPPIAPDDSCRLVLGLGPTPTTCSDDCYPFCGNKRKSGDHDSILKLGLSGHMEEVSGVFEYSVSKQTSLNTRNHHNGLVVPVADEGSTSAKKSGGYMPYINLAEKLRSSGRTLFYAQELLETGNKYHYNTSQFSSEPSALSDYSISTVSEPANTGTSSDRRTSNTKKCRFEGCTKGARGATGLCIGHGGGQRCQRPGCNKGAESKTAFCKAHGGGKRCQHLGCTKSAEGKTDHCIAHGGGRRCSHPDGCIKAARGKSGLCIRHGGGKRCKMEGCTRSAEGQVGLCISHGGGRRCQFPDCAKGAQGSTMLCKAHGGGKRCVHAGCTKGAEGSTPLCKAHGGGKRCLFNGGGICPKSVHGGTNFCVAHGGGKRCAVRGCTRSARGRTDCCVRHGGGKRCKFENCGKSAQGSTDFCKAHGGGKRCNWAESKCEKFARGKSGLCAAHSSMAQEKEANKRGMIGPDLFRSIVLSASTVLSSFENNCSSSEVSVLSDSVDSLEKPAKRQHLIPPYVLVPLSMKDLSSSLRPPVSEKPWEGKSFDLAIPEGRVHGGGLMSLLGGNLRNAFDGI